MKKCMYAIVICVVNLLTELRPISNQIAKCQLFLLKDEPNDDWLTHIGLLKSSKEDQMSYIAMKDASEDGRYWTQIPSWSTSKGYDPLLPKHRKVQHDDLIHKVTIFSNFG